VRLVGAKEDNDGVQEKQKPMACAATRSDSSLTDGSGLAKMARSHGRIPASFPSTPTLTSPAAELGGGANSQLGRVRLSPRR
jgi:hypothetical protein